MYYVVYVSSAVRPFTDAELLALLQQSQENNQRLGITGVLLYKDGNFIQVLEGERGKVLTQVAKIKRDGRHSGFLILLQAESEASLFPEWSMGFIPTSKLATEDQAAIDDFLKATAMHSDEKTRAGLHPTLKLLLSFKKHMR